MRNLSNDELVDYLEHAEAMLAKLPGQIDGSPELQAAVTAMMRAVEDAAVAFERLKADEPAAANQLMFAAVAALANLQTAKAIKEELKRRAEGN